MDTRINWLMLETHCGNPGPSILGEMKWNYGVLFSWTPTRTASASLGLDTPELSLPATLNK